VSDADPAPSPLPIRSLLFVPGNREDWIQKALASEADALVIDLESAIPRREAEAARASCAELLGEPGPGRPACMVRVSEAGSAEQERDLAAVVGPGLHGVMLPQVRGVEDVVATDAALGRAERAAGLSPGQTLLMPLVETAQAVRGAYEIARASARVAYMGGATSRGGDLTRSLGYRWTPEGRETLFLRSKVLVDVRAAGVANPISGLWGAVEDLEGLRVFAQQSRDLGYEGLMVIHPSHLASVNEIFSPSEAEIGEWQRIIETLQAAQEQGRGAIRLEGRLIDAAHGVTARQGLARARALGVID